MSTARKFHLVAFSFCLIASLAAAQAASIRFLPWDNSIAARKIGFHNGSEVVGVADLHPDKRTKPVAWVGGGEVPPQLIALDRTSPDGKPVSVPIKFQAGMANPLVLILPDTAHPTGLRCFVIEESSGSFGWGTFRFINATGKELLVRNEKVTKSLPATWNAVDLNPGGSARNMGIQLAARDNLEVILYSAVWEYDPEVRKLIIIVPGTDAQTGAVNLKIIPEDRRSAVTVAPASASEAP
jgi:hypothetical protein